MWAALLLVALVVRFFTRRRERKVQAEAELTITRAIEALPVAPASPERATEECAVCLAPFEAGCDVLRELPCEHAFHKECIDKWLKGEKRCPVCNTDVV